MHEIFKAMSYGNIKINDKLLGSFGKNSTFRN